MNPIIESELESITPRLIKGLCKMGVARDRGEDIVQDALLYLLSTGRLESFTPNGPASLFTFIFRKCLYILYEHSRHRTVIENGRYTLSVITHGLVERGGWEAREVLASLDPKDRDILQSRYGLGLSLAEMSAQYGVHRQTIRRWLKGAEGRLSASI